VATRSIYVPLREEELSVLGRMAKHEHRDSHNQAAHLITVALERWEAEQDLERSIKGEADLKEVA